MRIRYLVAIAALVVAAPLAAHSFQKPGSDQLGDTLREFGFIPKNPPTTLMTLGSIYYVDSEAKHFFPICIANKDDIGDAVRSSPSVELQQSLERKGQLATGISIDIGWLLKGSADSNYVVKVNYSLTDVRVEEIALGANWQVFGKLMDQPQCSQMAMRYLHAGGYVCQVTSRRRLIVGLPDWLSYLQAMLLELSPVPLLTRDNYESMKLPSVCGAERGKDDTNHTNYTFPFGIQPVALEAAAPAWLAPSGPRERYPQLRWKAKR